MAFLCKKKKKRKPVKIGPFGGTEKGGKGKKKELRS